MRAGAPTASPTILPTLSPTSRPTQIPTTVPTAAPTLAPAPNIVSLSAVVDPANPKTAVSITVELQSDAIVHCGVFRGANSKPLSVSDILMQRVSATSSSAAAVLRVPDLLPATTYSIYCATQSFEGALLSLSQALVHSATVHTSCCKTVSALLKVTSIAAQGAAVDALVLSLDSLPLQDLTLTLTAGNSSDAPLFYPSKLVFTNRTLTVSRTVTIAAGSVGALYTLQVQFSGADANVYGAVYTNGRSIAVLAALQPPAVPQLVAAMFTGDGSAVTLQMDAPTDQAGYSSGFACASLLDFVGNIAASCAWAGPSTIVIYPSNNLPAQLTLWVGSNVTVVSNSSVRAACKYKTSECVKWLQMPSRTVAIAAPAALLRPGVVLSLPSTLSGCAAMTMDLSASSNSGGRRWSPPVFQVTSAAGNNVTPLQRFLNGNFTFSPPSNIQSALFPQSGLYVFSVSLCNFLGACGQASRSVLVSKEADAAIVVSIPGQQLREVTTASALVITSRAYTVLCTGAESVQHLQFSWEVYDDDVLQPKLTSASVDQTVFRLSAYRLTPLHFYSIRLTVRHAQLGISSRTSVAVSVAQSELTAIVPGGATQSVPINGFIILDGSQSADRDVPLLTGSAARLSYTWVCVQTSPRYQPACPLDFSLDGSVIAAPSTEKLVLHALLRAVNTTALVTMTVTDALKSRVQAVSVSVKAQDSSAPVVTMVTNQAAVTAVDTRKTLLLSASVTVQSQCTALWSTNAPISNQLRDNALTPTTALVPTATTRVLNLLVTANALPVRSAMRFTLSCGPSSATIEVTTNGPPLPGAFSVLPLSGTELSTVFQLTASVWSDPHLPITYQFGFTSPSSGSRMTVQSRSESSTAATTLPAGSWSALYRLICIAEVFDSLSAASTATATITVNPQTNSTLVRTAMRAKLTTSVGRNDATKGVLSVGSAVLNVVRCDATPNCAGLHREPCSKVENTCGECLSGYVGDAGSKNAPCILPVPVSDTAVGGSVGDSCRNSTDCAGWAECRLSMLIPVCRIPSKPCPNRCSNQGACRYKSSFSSAFIADCPAGDPSCYALCMCNASFTGADCSANTRDVQDKQTLRGEFLQSLLAVAQTDDVTEGNMASLSVSLVGLAQNPYELTVESALTASAVATRILTNIAQLQSASYATVSGVLAAVDSAASATARSAPNASAASAVLDTVSLFTQLVESQLVVGQRNVEYVHDSFRMVAVRLQQQSGDLGGAMELSVPLTALEIVAGSVPSLVALDPASVGEDEVALSLISSSPSVFGSLGESFNTSPLRLRLSHSTAAPTMVNFTLRHHTAMEFTNASYAAALIFNSSCGGMFDQSVHYYRCPLSGKLLVHRCMGERGVMTSHCPVLRPSCSLLNASTSTSDVNSSVCTVSGYDAYSTNCSCTIYPASGPSSRRRRLSDTLAQSGVLDVVSFSIFLVSDFADTFETAEDFDSLEDVKKVLIVIVLFSALWGGGLLLILSCTWRRTAMEKVHISQEAKLQKRAERVQGSRSLTEVRRYLTEYVVTTFPAVFSNKPFFSRLYGEIRRHYRYIRIFTAEDGEHGDKQRILTGAYLLSMQTMLMFSLGPR